MNNIFNKYYIGKLSAYNNYPNCYLLVGILNFEVHYIIIDERELPISRREFKTPGCPRFDDKLQARYPHYKSLLEDLYSRARRCPDKSYCEIFGHADIGKMKADKVLAKINAAYGYEN